MTLWFYKKPGPVEPARRFSSGNAQIGSLLTEETILLANHSIEKGTLIDSLIARICKSHNLSNREELSAKIREREQGISTTLDTGLSIPHARIDDLSELVAGLALIPQGTNDPRQPLPMIRLVFLFLSPNKREFYPQHLQVLRKVASLFQPDFIEALNLASAAEALRLIRSKEG
jgi:mannitol/fructose-specific phosphotransferase system IIA component (Ntr-type)